MKNIAIVLITFILISSGNNVYSQKKGEIQLGLGSGLFNFSTFNNGISGTLVNSTSSNSFGSTTASSFSALFGYFPENKLRIDGGFSLNAYEGSDAAIYVNMGGRYFYYANNKVKLNGGVSANFGVTSGTKRSNMNPINLNIIPLEFQYWPLEGGGLTANFTYTRISINDNLRAQNSLGVNVGLLIRLQ